MNAKAGARREFQEFPSAALRSFAGRHARLLGNILEARARLGLIRAALTTTERDFYTKTHSTVEKPKLMTRWQQYFK